MQQKLNTLLSIEMMFLHFLYSASSITHTPIRYLQNPQERELFKVLKRKHFLKHFYSCYRVVRISPFSL